MSVAFSTNTIKTEHGEYTIAEVYEFPGTTVIMVTSPVIERYIEQHDDRPSIGERTVWYSIGVIVDQYSAGNAHTYIQQLELAMDSRTE